MLKRSIFLLTIFMISSLTLNAKCSNLWSFMEERQGTIQGKKTIRMFTTPDYYVDNYGTAFTVTFGWLYKGNTICPDGIIRTFYNNGTWAVLGCDTIDDFDIRVENHTYTPYRLGSVSRSDDNSNTCYYDRTKELTCSELLSASSSVLSSYDRDHEESNLTADCSFVNDLHMFRGGDSIL
jgi:hypothetical protein